MNGNVNSVRRNGWVTSIVLNDVFANSSLGALRLSEGFKIQFKHVSPIDPFLHSTHYKPMNKVLRIEVDRAAVCTFNN